MKFSDQEIGYYDPDEDATVWLPIQEYIRKFPDKIGVRSAMPGTEVYRTFLLPRAIDISFNPASHERSIYYESKRVFVLSTRSEGILLEVPEKVEATVTIDIDWPEES